MKKNFKSRILPISFALFFVLAIVLALSANFTFGDTANAPVRVLNYDTNRLYWVHGTEDIAPDGSYRIGLFDSLPKDDNGDRIMKPGDADKSVVRLQNTTGRKIYYKVVLYKISPSGVPVTADFTNISDEQNETIYTLPSGVNKSNVVRAVSGTLDGKGTQDFNIEWMWDFHKDVESDKFDTYLGNLERSDLTLGIYVTVTDHGTVDPTPPDINVDTDGDGEPDINLDTDGDGEPEINIDTDTDSNTPPADREPDINIDTDGDKFPDLNIDLNGDGLPDGSFDNNHDGVADTDIINVTVEDGIIHVPEETGKIWTKDIEKTPDLTLKLDNFGQKIQGAEFDADTLGDIMAHDGSIKIIMTNLRVDLDKQTVKSVKAQAVTNTIRVMVYNIKREDLTPAQQAVLDDKQIATAARAVIYSGDKIISSFDGGIVTIYMPHTIKKNTLLSDYHLYHVTSDARLEKMDSKYENEFFVFTTDHFSEFAVVYTGPENIGDLPAEPPVCTCMICLFGGNCTHCAVCWIFVVLIIFCIVSCIVMVLWRKFE